MAGFIVTQWLDIAEMKKTMTGLTRERDLAKRLLKAREDEIASLKQRMRSLEDAPVNTVNQENELDRWLGKTTQVRNFVKQHPQYAIPEFKYLTDRDWLWVTERGQLESEADYRKALAYLRQMAMGRASERLSQAIRDFTKENGGNPPRNYEDIIKYLPEDFDHSRYTNNPSGKTSFAGATNSERQIIKNVGPIDNIWDSEMWMNDKGQLTTTQISLNAENAVRAAIKRYQDEFGSDPVNSDQISKYINNNVINKADIDDIYMSMITPAK